MTKLELVAEKLNELSVGEKFSKKQFISTYWGNYDYFVERSFDVSFCKAKKQFPDREFKCVRKSIVRIK